MVTSISISDENSLVPVSLIVTPSHICLAIDGAACRVAAPADGANKKSGPQKAQFTFKARQKLLDLTSIVSLIFSDRFLQIYLSII